MSTESYLVVVERTDDEDYIANVPELENCRCSAPTVSEAFHRAENLLRRRLNRSGGHSRVRGPRRPIDRLRAALRDNAVAAATIRPRGTA
jgi:hypothetical protein